MRKKIKSNARKALSGCWGEAVCITLLFFTAVLFFMVLEALVFSLFDIPFFNGIADTPAFLFYGASPFEIILLVFVSVLRVLVPFFVTSPLALGMIRWYFRLVSEERHTFNDMLYYFSSKDLLKRSWKCFLSLYIHCLEYAVLFFLLPFAVLTLYKVLSASGILLPLFFPFLIIMLFSLAFVLLCFFLLRYFPVLCLIAEDDSLSIILAFRTSVQYTKRQHSGIFMFNLSFIVWCILSVFILPLLYSVPYYLASSAIYSKVLMEKGRRTATFGFHEYHFPDNPQGSCPASGSSFQHNN